MSLQGARSDCHNIRNARTYMLYNFFVSALSNCLKKQGDSKNENAGKRKRTMISLSDNVDINNEVPSKLND